MPVSPISCLSVVDIMSDLTTDEVLALSQRANVIRVEPKTQVYSPTQTTETVYFLHAGQVRLYHLAADGRMVTSALLDPGWLFGEMALLGQTMRGAYAETVIASIVCVMTVADVQTLLLSDLRISNRLVEAMARRLLRVEDQLAMITLRPVLNRVAWALVTQANGADDPTLHITHDAIATMIGATRETVTKALNGFQTDDLITLGRGQITLRNRQALIALADE